MIPDLFDYRRPSTVEEAISLLVELGEDAKLLAGGHSLIPLMRLRLATPSTLIDIGRIDDLSYIREVDDHIVIGSLTRHRDLEISELLREVVPVLPKVARHIGDPHVRHRGTIGGSLAHGDPASDLPAAILALEADLVVKGPAGDRVIPATEAFVGFLETALRPDELLVEVRIPRRTGKASFQKFVHRAQDWAIVGAVVVTNGRTGIGLINMGATPLRARATEEVLAQGGSAGEAAELADEGTEPTSDLAASAEYRRYLAKVLVRRALEEVGY